MINNKADLNTTKIELQSKVTKSEFDSLKSTINDFTKDINFKLDINKFESVSKDIYQVIDDLQKDIMSKSNIKEVLSLLKNKTGK